MNSQNSGPVVLGVTADQPDTVAEQAVSLATAFKTSIVFVWADMTQYSSGFLSDGTMAYSSFDPEPFDGASANTQWIDERAERVCSASGIEWESRVLVGQPARVISSIADEVDARLIVVGTREPGFLAGLAEFLGGSVAAHLSHTQSRPVVVVPLNPVKAGDKLPWGDEL